MAKFRKLPVVISAERHNGARPLIIKTLEGDMIVTPGDWIVTGVRGEKYPCKDEIFRLTYEPVDQAAFTAVFIESKV